MLHTQKYIFPKWSTNMSTLPMSSIYEKFDYIFSATEVQQRFMVMVS